MTEIRTKLSLMTPCYNEEENVALLYEKVKDIFAELKEYDYEYIFIDNASTDNTVKILKDIASRDKRLKIIVNSRNFGHVRSPYYGLLQGTGEAVICLAADFQDPPEMIKNFISKWKEGYKIVLAVKSQSRESKLMFITRKLFYNLIGAVSEVNLIKNSTGFGLYDKKIVEILRGIDDPYPYLRGLICDIGFEKSLIEFTQPARHRGKTKNNLYSLYDLAMLGITSHSKVPLRLATILGFFVALCSLLVAIIYLLYKIIFWKNFTVGTAPIVIGLFFFSAVQLFFIGVLGEYIGAIHTQVLKRPVIVEKERINF